jgi:cell division protein FtsW
VTPFLRAYAAPPAQGEPGRGIDRTLATIVLALVAIGIVMVYSASSALGGKEHGDELFFLKAQTFRSIVGLVAMFLIAGLNPSFLENHARKILVGALALLVLVIIPGVGIEVRHARRWLPLGFMTFQPAELMKLALVIYLADFLTRREKRLDSFRRGLMPPLVVLGIASLLILRQPSLGAVVLLGLLTGCLLLVGGARLWHLALVFVALSAVGTASIAAHPYQRERFQSFFDNEYDTSGEEYQVYQGMLALGSGGPFGKGFGHSQQKFFFLPDAHTDFIMAILGEEVGFAGTAVVILLFAALIARGLLIAWRAATRFTRLLAFGITASIFLQMALNLLVITHLVPTTGQPLPFLSYGGSNLTLTLIHMGVLLSLSRNAVARPAPRFERDERVRLGDDAIPSGAQFLTP